MANSSDILRGLIDIGPQQNMSDKIFQQISSLILKGDLPSGYVFPNENDMCQQFSIGRSTLREAYKALELQGYVTRTKKGTVVNDLPTIYSSTPLKTLAASSSDQDFKEVRLLIETKIAELAAIRATDEEIQGLQEVLDRLQVARYDNDSARMAELDKEFHDKLAAATHNALMVTIMLALSESWKAETRKNFLYATSVDSKVLDDMQNSYRALLDSVDSHDPESAIRLMTGHIELFSKKYVS